MKNRNPYAKLDRIIKVMRVQDIEVKLKHAQEDYEREAAELAKMTEQVAKGLDPLMREKYKDDPEKLAEWEEIMHDYESIEEEGADETES
ncbi:MAG: hypothetical protein WCB68_23865 [Pyrinomonadaceae bacterium]